jgi:hypothetical protein
MKQDAAQCFPQVPISHAAKEAQKKYAHVLPLLNSYNGIFNSFILFLNSQSLTIWGDFIEIIPYTAP